ncbi:type II toxin-antitoxin system HicB family antitoxin [Sporosarcina trichiuri]|uniref:type II toxin-antitoxin system HicB family antitoxin n=1 Tax=Sporosarcina trichiuri TaxID=3056445 RepID=UPI0025B5B660|nr:type II toxin-antitoxin system HicB family antitoxin [Sporosarcina sp. 0.2-SM1T-5]WJY28054.1 type II toxin-antitoxin system HicB family antitoxin [Sporosarcina sp. 0.2-SM1T-5]
MKKDRYLYPALFDYADDGISISFPDLPGCFSCADSDEEAMLMAKEALSLHLYGMEVDGEPIPSPTPAEALQTDDNQTLVSIDVWMSPFRLEMQN